MKIWRYIDLAKLVSLLSTESLYFACPSQFVDPYEGLLPTSHMEAHSRIVQSIVDPILKLRGQFPADSFQKFDASVDILRQKMRTVYEQVKAKFGVSCWHKNEHESAAMWKLYSDSGKGIAIESTVGQLRDSLKTQENLQIDSVRYMDFDNEPIEKGHERYLLFIKRNSFEHERELRATVLLREAGKGIAVKCDLEVLINCIHVSPSASPYFGDAVESLCSGKLRSLQKPVLRSKLLDAPECGIDIDRTLIDC